MPTIEECNAYADEMARRFEEFTAWAIANWPDPSLPLMTSDFEQSRKEIGALLGPRLHDSYPDRAKADDYPQYRDVNPAPWP